MEGDSHGGERGPSSAVKKRLAELAAAAATGEALRAFLLVGEEEAVRRAAEARVLELADGLARIVGSGPVEELDEGSYRVLQWEFEKRERSAAVAAAESLEELLTMYGDDGYDLQRMEIFARIFEREGCVEELRRAGKGPNGVWALGVLSEVAEERVAKEAYREAYLTAVALSVEYCRRIDDGDFPARRAINVLEDAADLFEERMGGEGGEVAAAKMWRKRYHPRYRMLSAQSGVPPFGDILGEE